MRCPDCGRKAVYLRLCADDVYECKRCYWYAYERGNDDHDVRERERLDKLNPNKNITVRYEYV